MVGCHCLGSTSYTAVAASLFLCRNSPLAGCLLLTLQGVCRALGTNPHSLNNTTKPGLNNQPLHLTGFQGLLLVCRVELGCGVLCVCVSRTCAHTFVCVYMVHTFVCVYVLQP